MREGARCYSPPMRFPWCAVVALVLIPTLGCGDDSGGGDSADASALPDGASNTDAPPGTPDAPPAIDSLVAADSPFAADAAVACNNLTQVGSPVQPNRVAQTFPTATGGTIPTGTYVRTATTIYTGPGGPTGPVGIALRESGRYNGNGTVDTILTTNLDVSQSLSYTTNGSTITFTGTCPAGSNSPFDAYTVVNATTLQLFDNDSSSVVTLQFQ
jgi:hypothetical protein